MTTTIKTRDAAKAECGTSLVFVRVGEFYELFREDAEIAAKTLGLTLCRMAKRGEGADVAMCGFPAWHLDACLSRLVRLGHTAAIVETASSL